MEEENVVVDNSNTTEEVALETTEDVTVGTDNTEASSEEESIDEVKARLAKAEELAKNYKIRAEKAEGKNKEAIKTAPKPVVQPTNNNTMSPADMIAVIKSGISDEDLSEVEEFAKFKKVSISEALKSSTLKNILAEKEEVRKAAAATNIGTQRKSSTKTSDDSLLDAFNKGEMPTSDADLNRLIKARKGIK